MPHRYSPEDREFALQCVVANHGDIAKTARELGISPRTLYEWRKSANMATSQLQNLRNLQQIPQEETLASTDSNASDSAGTGRALSTDSQGGNALPPDDLQALRDLKAQMLELAAYIMADDRIKQAIDAAPLNQRIAALAQLIDRIIKLAAELPAPKDESWKLALLDEGDDEEEEDENDEDEY